MEAKLYNQQGKETGNLSLSDEIFGLPWNADLVHQVVVSMTANEREPIAHTKTRGEVRGGGRKPWRQKGTGRARHGSTRSPIWVGGGVTHGPRNDKDFSRKINKKMKSKALFTILSAKLRDGEMFFLDSLTLSEPKTNQAVSSLKTLEKLPGFPSISNKKRNAVLIALPEHNPELYRSFRNLGNVSVDEARNLNPLSLLKYKAVLLVNPEEAVKLWDGKVKTKKVAKTEKAEAKEKKAKAPAKKTATKSKAK